MKHEKFAYRDLDQLKEKAEQLGVHLPLAADTSMLRRGLSPGMMTVPNRMGVAPMEGADTLPDGSPSRLTTRRCVQESVGGNSLIWFEAISIVPEERSSVYQLMLTRDNLNHYKQFTEETRGAEQRENDFALYLVIQVNHSGRYSNPQSRPTPLIAYRHPEYEKLRPADGSCVALDDYLKPLGEKLGEATMLAREVGSDTVDIKSYHECLLAELTPVYNRTGRYGGSFENRTRLLCNGIVAAKNCESDRFLVTAHIGIFDGSAYPYGFGVKEGSGEVPNMEEPIRLVRSFYENYGLPMINLIMGSPYASTHVTRPYDFGEHVSDEHPLFGIARLINGIGTVKKAVPNMVIPASGPLYLRQYSDLFAAGAIEEGLCDQMLFGRMPSANPEPPKQIVETERMDPKKTCITCGKCGDLIRAGKSVKYVVQDTVLYLKYYRGYLEETKEK